MPPNHDALTNKLSVYMIKPEYERLEDIVDSEETPIPIEGVGQFVFEESHPHQPDWVRNFFGSTLGDNRNIFTSSARGVLVVPVTRNGRTTNFVISFGVGRFLLKEGVFEERFGLKVVLNSVDPESFRSIDKTTLGTVPKHSHEQMSREVAPSDFGIDVEQDLINSVTGKSRDEVLGKKITGKDALNVSVKVDNTNIVEFLSHCLERYESADYKTNFDWIDQIAEVRDKRLEEELSEILMERLNTKQLAKVWMAVPEVVNWSDVKGFRHMREKRADMHDDLHISDFLACFPNEHVDMEQLRLAPVFMVSVATDHTSARWPAFRCMYAEITLRGKFYILNSGKWYEIANGFTDQVQRDFENIPESTIVLPDCEVNDEGSYNEVAAASLAGSCCMDGKLIMHGGGHSRIEFCDIYTGDGKLIHVKKYAGSGVLSHLFSQGAVSGELFVSDVEFRSKLNAQLPATHKLSDPTVRPNPLEHEVVYAIISDSSHALEIPFFSKVTLRNARRRLTSYGYPVSIKKILKVEPPVAVVPEEVVVQLV